MKRVNSIISILLSIRKSCRQRYLLPLVLLSSSTAVNAEFSREVNYLAELSLEELMQVEVTISTNTRQPRHKAPSVVSVISATDIEKAGAANLVEILETVPGIHIFYNTFAFRPLISFRGAKANQTLLMVNGSPMKDLYWGFGNYWKGLPVSMIDRVEIIRGPGSAVYGADAAAGVINVITKTAAGIHHNEVGVRAGSYNSQTAWAQYGGDWNGFDINFTADIFQTDGHSPLIESDAIKSQSASNSPSEATYGWSSQDWRFSMGKDNWDLLFDYSRHNDLEVGLTGGGTLEQTTTAAEDSRLGVELRYSNKGLSEDLTLDSVLRYDHLDYDSGEGFMEQPPGYQDSSGNTYTAGLINKMAAAERRINWELSSLYSGLEHHELHFGLGITWQDLYEVEQQVNFGTGPDGNILPVDGPLVTLSDTSYAFAPEKARTNLYLFLQDVWQMADAINLTLGARLDRYSDFGTAFNPRIALVWENSPTLTTKLIYGEAYRAPSYQELFADTSFSVHNEGLDPENSSTLELSLAYLIRPNLHLELNLFQLHLEDMIGRDSNMQYQNIGEHTINGVELEARWQLSDRIRLAGNYSQRDSGDSSFRALYEPERDGYLRFNWRLTHDWFWNLQGNWIGKRVRSSSDSRDTLDGYQLTDTTIRYQGAEWIFSGSIRNLFDTNAREYTGRSIANDLPLPGRNVYIDIHYRF